MADFPTLFALARDRSEWLGTRSGLALDGDGNLRLDTVPAVTPPVVLPAPYDVPPSGIAASPCGGVALAETEAGRVLLLDGLCGDAALLGRPGSLPGEFASPAALLLTRDDLYVADAGNARVEIFALPALELRAMWRAGMQRPIGLAADGAGRIMVLDEAAATLRRFAPSGAEDVAYAKAVATAIATQGGLRDPRFLAIGALDWTLVADAGLDSVIAFDEDGNWIGALEAPDVGWQPRALVAIGARLYVVDAAIGMIRVMDAPSGQWLGTLASYCGPVAALAADGGDLLVKPGADDTVIRLAADAGHVAQGSIALGPLDAGEQSSWWRCGADADTPVGTAIGIESFCAPVATPAPGVADYTLTPSPDLLIDVAAPSAAAAGNPERARFLWLRVTLTTTDPAATPVLRQMRAQTPGEDMMTYLPGLFGLADGSWSDPPRAGAPRGFLSRLLALFQSEMSGAEAVIDDLSRLLETGFAPASDLDWLASMLALPTPPGITPARRRALLQDAVALQGRRGTPASLRALIALWTGANPRVVELYRERRIWQLDGAGLGFGTALPPLDPEGFLVAAETPGSACAIEIGTAMVGTANPAETADFGTSLFAPEAHRFVVMLQAHEIGDGAALDAVRAVIDREKPAHTAYELCVVAPRMRVGLQSRIGVDSIVAGPPPPLRLDQSFTDIDAVTAAPPGRAGRVGARAAIGRTTVLG